jgi:hypothetical protein
MTSDQQRGQLAPTEAPATGETESHTTEDHRAASPEAPYSEGAKVTAPFQEAKSLPTPTLGKEK